MFNVYTPRTFLIDSINVWTVECIKNTSFPQQQQYSSIRKSVLEVIDGYLSSKQGSLCTFKVILIETTKKYFKYVLTYIYVCYKILT